MAAPLLPQDVTEHLATAIQISNRHIHWRFLEEAETLLSLHLPAAAIMVAGVVLEFLVAGQLHQPPPGELQQIERWSQLRNNAVHSHARSVTLEQATEMVTGVRQLLLRRTGVGPEIASADSSKRSSERVRGKYKFVPTSSEEFIARKADERQLEH